MSLQRAAQAELAVCFYENEEQRTFRAAIESAMEETGLPPAVRGETLSIAQFAALSNALLRKFDK